MRSRPCSFFYVLLGLALATQPFARGFEEPGPNPTISGASPTPSSLGQTFRKDTASAAVRFDLYQGYLIVVHGSVGPLKDLNFFVDTGATPTILDLRIARKLNLEEASPASIVILGGRAEGGKAILPWLELGPVQRSNLQVVTEDLSFVGKALPVRIDAIVGLDVLGHSPFTIDYARREIRFGTPAPLSTVVPLRMKEGLATVDAEVNHAPVRLLLDTGASSLTLFEMGMPAPGQRLRGDAVTRPANTIGDFERKSVWLHTFTLGDARFGQEPAFMVHNRKEPGLDFDGLMNPVALGITRISVDLQRGEVGFSY